MAQLNFNAANHPLPASATAAPQRNWSKYQTAIFDFVQNGNGNATVKAVAGSGKTTTIVEACDRAAGSTLFLAFNKAIADELKERGVNARTFHSLTYSAVTKLKGTRQIETDKLRKLCDQHMSGDDVAMYGAFCCKMVGLARQAGIGCLVPDVELAWLELAIHHDIEPDDESADMGYGMELASKLLGWSNASKMVDFDDLLYIAVKEGVSLTKYDMVFVDEAQDTNAIQRALLRKVMHKGSRMVAVGDPAQAIYGFRGADSNSLNILAEEFNCIELPLTVSYRCPTAVIEHARKWVEHIEAAPGAPEGLVVSHDAKWELSVFQKGDMVVCRTTKPLIGMAYQLIKARIPAKIMGRELGQGLKALVLKMNSRNLDHMVTKLDAYTGREIEKAVAKKQDSKAESIQDKADAIMFLVETLDQNQYSITGLLNVIDSLFEGVDPVVTLATIHKSKGLEADRVFWLNASKCPADWARQDWQREQERNLCYVATTRAKKELHLIEEREVKF